jgi:hypothetical protein
MAGIVGLTTLQHQNATNAMTVDTSGYLTASQPVLAKLVMTSDQNNLTEETWTKMKLDSAVIDTKSGFNNTNDTYVIPVSGYYRITAHAHLGVIGEAGSTRDTGLCVTRTRSGTETQLVFSHTRTHIAGGGDTSDATENVYTIDECQASDIITVYVYCNTDTGTAYDVFADVDANENTHMNTGLPGAGNGEDTSSFLIVERII